MGYKTGWCGAGATDDRKHPRCAGISENGAKAPQRYLLCTCECHDGDSGTFERVYALLKDWPVAEPLNASAAELSRYVDTVNALLRPTPASYGND